MHTQIDLRGNIPSFIHVSDGKMHEVNELDLMTPEPGSFSIMDRGFLDFARLYRLTQRYPSNYPTKTFSHLDQYLSMAFAQLTFRESLRDIEVCLRAHEAKLYHLGIRGHVARSNLGDANEKRDWRIYRDFANSLIAQARRLYADDAFAVDLDNTVYALDTTTIDLSLKVFAQRNAGTYGVGESP